MTENSPAPSNDVNAKSDFEQPDATQDDHLVEQTDNSGEPEPEGAEVTQDPAGVEDDEDDDEEDPDADAAASE